MSNNNQNNNPESKLATFLSGKGFYLVLAVCLIGAGSAAWMAMGNESAPPTPPNTQSAPGPSTALLENANRSQSNIPIGPSKPSKPSSSEPASQSSSTASQKPADSSAPPNTQVASQKLSFVLPIESEILTPFTHPEMAKDPTMGDWRSHNGIDIKATDGTPVRAAAAGKVLDVRNDVLWGYVVELEHTGGLTSLYCGLAKDPSVKKGESVKSGAMIGKVSYIPVESKLPIHLHFEMKKDGKYVNPLQTMGMK